MAGSVKNGDQSDRPAIGDEVILDVRGLRARAEITELHDSAYLNGAIAVVPE